MFFMLGTWPRQKSLGTHRGYRVTMTYLSLIIFFIPLFKFSKRYFAELNGKIFELSREVGEALERGEEPDLGINESKPTNESGTGPDSFQNRSSQGQTWTQTNESGPVPDSSAREVGRIIKGKMCMRCGFKTKDMSLTHCPDCENKLVYDD